MNQNLKNRPVAFIPARGGSRGIENKNIIPIADKPLIYWVIKAAATSNAIKHVYVSTDCAKICSCVESFGFKDVSVIPRSQKSASDTAPSEIALLDFCENLPKEQLVYFIQATSPLLTAHDIDKSWEEFIKSDFDSMLAVVHQHRFNWVKDGETKNLKPINYSLGCRPRRQDFEGYYLENGAFYISRCKDILKSKNRLSGKIGGYEMPAESLVEIDTYDDLVLAEFYLKKKNKP